MSEHQATGSVTKSAMQADVSQPTARKYLAAGQTPEQLQATRHWRTRPDPVAGIWPQAEAMLLAAPDDGDYDYTNHDVSSTEDCETTFDRADLRRVILAFLRERPPERSAEL